MKNAISANGIRGLFNSISPAITSKDIANINEYNRLVSVESVSSQTAWYRTMMSSSKAAQSLFDDEKNLIRTNNGLILSEEAVTQATNTMSLSAKAAELGMKALSIAGNMAIMWGITEVIKLISSCATASDRLRESAKELGSQFSSTKSEIEDYKAKVEDLYKTINDSSSSYEDTYNARKELLTIQDELIEKFGSESEAVKLVTEAINGQTDAFDELTQRQWQEMKNEFNDTDLASDMLNLFSGYKSNIDRMMDEYGHYKIEVDLSHASSNYKSKEAQEIRELLEANGMEISYTMNGTGVPFVELSGTADEVHDKIVEIQELFSEDNPLSTDNFSNYLTMLANSAKKMSDQYKEMYDNYVLYEEIFKNNDYKDSFRNITDAYEEYRKASISGDEEAIAKATENYADIITSAMEDALENGDTDVVGYFESMYPELQSVIEQWEFKTKILPDFDVSGLKGKTENEVLEMLQTEGTQDGEGVFNSLIEKATEYGVVTGENSEKVQQLLDLLVDLEILQREISEDAQDVQSTSLSFQEAWASLDTTEDDNVNSLKNDLLSLAEAGQLTLETFKDTEGSDTFLSMLGIEDNDTAEIDKLISRINQLKTSADQLSSMKDGISGLAENLYNRQQNPGVAIDADVLAGMNAGLKEMTMEWEKYETVLGNASSSMADVQKATDELATAYVNSNNFLANLTETNKDYYVSQLDSMGVANSSKVVEERLNAQMEVAKFEAQAVSVAIKDLDNSLTSHSQNSKTAQNDTYANSSAFLQQAEMTDLAKISLANLIANEQIFASTDLNTNQKVAELNKLALAYFGVANAIQISSAMGGDWRYWNSPDQYDKAIQDGWNAFFQQQMQPYFVSVKNPAPPKDGNTTKEPTPKEETKEEKEFSEIFDWFERRIKNFQRAFDKWLKQAETAVTSGFINKYYKKAISSAKNQLSTYSDAYNRYMAETNAVGLDEKYAKKVRNGTLDIETIYAKGSEEDIKQYEENAEKIKKYQDWWDKAQDSMDSFMETAEKLYNLPLDKAATKIEKFNDSIDLLDKKLANAIGSNKKNKLIDQQKEQEKYTLNAYKTAQAESKKNLKSAKKELKKNKNLDADDGITAKEKKKIQDAVKNNKEVNLSFFKEGTAGYKEAVKYNEALKANKKAIYDAQTAQQDYNRYLVEAAKQKFDNIVDDYNKEVQKKGWKMSALDNKISEIEAAGKNVDKSYYKSQKKVNNKTLKQYQAEKTALEKNLKKIKEGTDEWYDAKDQIQQVDNAISDCVKTTYELNNAINQLHFDLFDDVSDGIKRIITEQEFLQGLFAHEKNADTETGNFTEAGLAKLGSLSASYYASKENADRDKAMLEDLQKVKSKGKQKDGTYKLGDWTFNSLDDLQAKIDEVYTKWQDDIKETYSLESSIVDAMKEKYQAELDLLKDLIDKKKEALNAEKDLHDYQKSISEKTENISVLQKRIAAYSGDTSQEGMAKLQKLQKELAEKEEDLRETEYDKYISDQQDMLDKLYEEYQELMSKKMDDFMTLVQEGLKTSNDNTAIIATFIREVAKKYGYKIETDGLFNNSSGGIEGNVGKKAESIDKNKTKLSGTQDKDNKKNNTPSTKEPTQEKVTTAPLAPPKVTTAPIALPSSVDGIKSYIKEHANKAKKDKKEYSDINQKIYENKAKSYKGTGKVLSSKELKGLAKKLGVNYDGASKTGNLYKVLKGIKFPGFSKGGVVSADKIHKQIKANGDDGIVSVKNGEGILTQLQTAEFKKLAEEMPEMLKNAASIDWMLPISRSMSEISNARNMNNVVNIDNITLPNVTNYDEFKDRMFKDMQNDRKYLQFTKDASINLLDGAGRLAKNRTRF